MERWFFKEKPPKIVLVLELILCIMVKQIMVEDGRLAAFLWVVLRFRHLQGN